MRLSIGIEEKSQSNKEKKLKRKGHIEEAMELARRIIN